MLKPSKVSLAAFVAVLLAFLAAACGSGDGPAASEDSPQGKGAIARYRAYLDEKASELVAIAGEMVALVKAGHLGEAGARYASARVRYGQLEPFSESFPALDLRIDAPVGGGSRADFTGFHRVERELWLKNDGPASTREAERLLANVKELGRRVRLADLRGETILRSGLEVLHDVSASEVRGKEDPYFHIDLVDIAADVEGVEATFEAVEPTIAESDPELVAEVRSKLKNVYADLRDFGWASREPDQPRPSSPGTSFVLYTQRTQAEFLELNRRIEALAEALAQAQEEIANS
jgi:iron uptake system component EfeO